jgi:RimJ/RimL family protein N-acetyltransferase
MKYGGDLVALKRGKGDQATEVSRFLAAYRKGDGTARVTADVMAGRLRAEGRDAELLRLHADLEMPRPPLGEPAAAALGRLEWEVLSLPGLPSAASDLADRRLGALLRYYDLGWAEPAILMSLALLRLRQRRYADAESLCRQLQSGKGFPPVALRPVLGMAIYARKALGQPTGDLVSSALALGVDARLSLDAIRQAIDPGFRPQLQAGLPGELGPATLSDPERAQRMCGRGHHLMLMPGLRLQTPSMRDLRAMAAAASDPQAQHWLGWTDQTVQQARQWTGLLDAEPGKGGRVPGTLDGKVIPLVAIDPSGRRLAGGMTFTRKTGEIGGWLAPGFRGLGLGSALFAGAAEFAHHHLGADSVLAGTEADNSACIGSLSAAGFTSTAGPDAHTLENGRVVAARWFRHESGRPAFCAGVLLGKGAAPRLHGDRNH